MTIILAAVRFADDFMIVSSCCFCCQLVIYMSVPRGIANRHTNPRLRISAEFVLKVLPFKAEVQNMPACRAISLTPTENMTAMDDTS